MSGRPIGGPPWSVAGALGRGAHRLSVAPEAARWRSVRRRGVVIVASRELLPLARRGGWAWNPYDPSVRLRSADDARRTALAACCASRSRGEWELATDDLGLQPLFYSVVDATIWFATSPALLIDVVRRSTGVDLSTAGPDPVGWQSIMLVGFPAPGRSAYREIRTLQPAGSVSIDVDGAVRVRSGVGGLDSSGPASVDDLIDALRSAMPETGRYVLPLSGGWDSRILAALLRPGTDVTAWTTTVDDGTELDVSLAPLVARHLGLDHRIFHDARPTWTELARAELRLAGYQTWYHVWLLPLAAHLGREPQPVIDGFGGDFVLRRLFQRTGADGAFDVDAVHDAWRAMGGGRAASDVAWSEDAQRWFASSAFESFRASAELLRDHPNWQAQLVLTTRAARCIGVAPTRLMSTATPARMPFLAAEVRSTLYTDPVYARRGHDLYRELLARIDRDLAALPSTNDLDRVVRGGFRRREASPDTLWSVARQISSNPDAMRLLSPKLRAAVDTADIDALSKLTRYVVPQRALQAVFALTQWHLDHPGSAAGIWDP